MKPANRKKRKRVLILGVGNVQVDAILHCRDLGYEVFGVSYREEGRSLEFLDHFEQINIVDKEAVLDYAQSSGCDLVYSVGSDLAMPTVGFVSERLGIPSLIDEHTAELLRDKGRLRAFLSERHLGSVPFHVACVEEDLADWDTFPAVIKPVDSQGQRGIFEVKNAKEARAAFLKSLSFSRAGEVIIERYINGPEISVNAFVHDGEVVYSFITDRYVAPDLPGGIVSGHRLPSHIPAGVREKTDSLMKGIISALGIRNGPVYSQLKYEDDNVFVIEVTPRLDGCHLWRLISLKYGVDLLELCFLRLMNSGAMHVQPGTGEPESLRDEDLRLDFFLQEPGTRFRKEACAEYGVLHREWYYNEGDTIRPINGYAEKTGYQIRSLPG